MSKIDYSCDFNNLKPSEQRVEDELITRINEDMVPNSDLQELSQLFKVFGDGTRIRILAALECSELCVHELTVVLDMTKSAISHQLKVLRDNNLVKFEKKGKHAYYSLADDHVKKILDIALEHINE